MATNYKHLPRETGFPQELPIKLYRPAVGTIPADAPEIIVGCDTGVSNCAFCELEVIRDPATNAIVDFKYNGTYYFADELSEYSCRLDKQLIIMRKYYELFSRKRVTSLTFEAIFTDSTKDADTRSGIIATMETTAYLSLISYLLQHHYDAVPAPAIKRCLTGNGKAQKSDMCFAAYSWTKDAELLSNSHRADAFACAFYDFIFKKMTESCLCQGIPIPQKFAHMDWNFKSISASGQGSS